MKQNMMKLPNLKYVVFSPGNGVYQFTEDEDIAVSTAATVDVVTTVPKFKQVPVRVLSILTTDDCNLACSYCYMNHCKPSSFAYLDMDTFIAAFDSLISKDVSILQSIGFMGGEPTLNMTLIEQITTYVRARNPGIGVSITTNGTKLLDVMPGSDLTVLEWMFEHNISIKLSIAGPADIHNKERSDCHGNPTHSTLMNMLRFAKQISPEKTRLGMDHRVTLTLGDGTLLNRLQYFNLMLAQGYGSNVHFETDVDIVLSEDELVTTEAAFTADMIAASDWIIAEIKAGNRPIWNDMIQQRIGVIIGQVARSHSCAAGASLMSIGPKGELRACHRSAGCDIGTIADGLDRTLYGDWVDTRATFRVDCRTCDIRRMCGGGCRAVTAALGLGTRVTHPTECMTLRVRILMAFYIIDEVGEDVLCELYGFKKPSEGDEKNE